MQWYSKKTGKELPTLKATTLENGFSRLKDEKLKPRVQQNERYLYHHLKEKFQKLTLTVPSGYYLKNQTMDFPTLEGVTIR